MRWPVTEYASAKRGRCPVCGAPVWSPYDWHDPDITRWVRASRRLVEAHVELEHPDRRPWPVGYYDEQGA